jgi:imidazolonepropionase
VGILYTVDKTRQEHEVQLFYKGRDILDRMLEHGTTTVEIKSGYGLDYVNEFKMLEVISGLGTCHRTNPLFKEITVIPTFLGAHAIPKEFKSRRTEYVEVVLSILSEIAKKGLAEFCDVFCDPTAFTVEESILILEEAMGFGFKLKAHVGQNYDHEKSGKFDAHKLINALPLVSVDHMDYADLDKIESRMGYVATLLPGVTYHLMEMQANKLFWSSRAQKLIDDGFAVALATNYNPGSCPCFSMQTIMELAARLYRMTPAQIINAVTINAAHAVGRAHEIGSIEVGKRADIIICDVPDCRELINSFGTNKAWKVIKNGIVVK